MIEIKSSMEKGIAVKVEGGAMPYMLPTELAMVMEQAVSQVASQLGQTSSATFSMVSAQIQSMIKLKENK